MKFFYIFFLNRRVFVMLATNSEDLIRHRMLGRVFRDVRLVCVGTFRDAGLRCYELNEVIIGLRAQAVPYLIFHLHNTE